MNTKDAIEVLEGLARGDLFRHYLSADGCAAILAGLAALREAEWLPIETAPQDGTRVMVSNRYGTWLAEYRPIAGSGYRFDNPWRCMLLNRDHIPLGATPEEWGTPTHWRPIPTPPANCAPETEKTT